MLMKGKRGLVVGVANKWSIAWAISKKLVEEGAELALSYQNERLGKHLRELVPELGLTDPMVMPMDVSSDEQIARYFHELRKHWDQLDFLVHAVAFAPKEALEGAFYATSREAFRIAHEVSSYSLTGLTRAALPMMKEGSSILTLSYLGAERAIPNYNVMGVAKASLEASVRYLASDLGPTGIRVNAVSAGPIKTLAASGISGFSAKQRCHRSTAPLRRDTETDEVADAAVFLLSNMGRGITGQVLYVDGGYCIMGN